MIGSDAHNNKNRNFLLKPALLKTEKIIGNTSVSIIKNNSKKILNGEIPLSYSKQNKKKSVFSKISSFFK